MGTSAGELDGSPFTRKDLYGAHPAGSWPGERKDSYLPMLFLRANPGDTGTRPVVGPFWESPDIYILGGVDAALAPDVPPELGQVAEAGRPNTVYAHVWNFGRSAARDVIVDFFWLNPSLGVGPGSAHRIGQTTVSLECRGSEGSHAIVKCPESWTATYENGGHECLLVRAWTLRDDRLGSPEWDASLNRHVGQRNIHVMSAAELAGDPMITLEVGALFGLPATVRVDRTPPSDVPWLQLRTGAVGRFPAQAAATGIVGLTAPTTTGGGVGAGQTATSHTVSGDDQQVGFTTTDAAPGAGEANVYRVTAAQGGQTIGGFTVVVQG